MLNRTLNYQSTLLYHFLDFFFLFLLWVSDWLSPDLAESWASSSWLFSPPFFSSSLASFSICSLFSLAAFANKVSFCFPADEGAYPSSYWAPSASSVWSWTFFIMSWNCWCLYLCSSISRKPPRFCCLATSFLFFLLFYLWCSSYLFCSSISLSSFWDFLLLLLLPIGLDPAFSAYLAFSWATESSMNWLIWFSECKRYWESAGTSCFKSSWFFSWYSRAIL